MAWWRDWMKSRPFVPVVKLSGVIGPSQAFRPGLNIGAVAGALDRAFSYDKAPCVALLINSPGGSPVQSHLIFKRIRALAAENEKKVLVFCEDVAASGGYMLACAGDEIFADQNSIIGSIGVISAGFGLHKLIDKIGVERRVYTAGERKLTLDPFQPENADDVARLKSIQADIHAMFTGLVAERRGEKIAGREAELFTGEFWTGTRAKDLGLIDGIGDVRGVVRERFGKDVRLKVISAERGLFRRRLLATDRATPSDWVSAGLTTLEGRATWARFGL